MSEADRPTGLSSLEIILLRRIALPRADGGGPWYEGCGGRTRCNICGYTQDWDQDMRPHARQHLRDAGLTPEKLAGLEALGLLVGKAEAIRQAVL